MSRARATPEERPPPPRVAEKRSRPADETGLHLVGTTGDDASGCITSCGSIESSHAASRSVDSAGGGDSPFFAGVAAGSAAGAAASRKRPRTDSLSVLVCPTAIDAALARTAAQLGSAASPAGLGPPNAAAAAVAAEVAPLSTGTLVSSLNSPASAAFGSGGGSGSGTARSRAPSLADTPVGAMAVVADAAREAVVTEPIQRLLASWAGGCAVGSAAAVAAATGGGAPCPAPADVVGQHRAGAACEVGLPLDW